MKIKPQPGILWKGFLIFLLLRAGTFYKNYCNFPCFKKQAKKISNFQKSVIKI